MPKLSTAKRYNFRYRRLHYGSIELVPVADRDSYPYNLERYRNAWHVPGRTIMSTDALVQMAARKGIVVKLSEHSGVDITLTRLN